MARRGHQGLSSDFTVNVPFRLPVIGLQAVPRRVLTSRFSQVTGRAWVSILQRGLAQLFVFEASHQPGRTGKLLFVRPCRPPIQAVLRSLPSRGISPATASWTLSWQGQNGMRLCGEAMARDCDSSRIRTPLPWINARSLVILVIPVLVGDDCKRAPCSGVGGELGKRNNQTSQTQHSCGSSGAGDDRVGVISRVVTR